MLALRPDLADGLEERFEEIASLRRELDAFDDVRAFWAVRRTISTFKPHILHTHTAKAGTIGRMAGISARVPLMVHTFHGTVFEGHFNTAAARAVVLWERLLARKTHALLGVSPAVGRQLMTSGFPLSRIRMVPLGLDLERFAGVPPLPRTAPPVLTLVARLAPVKDVPLFIEAAALCREEVPNLEVRVAGDGPLRDELVRSAPSWVQFLGNRADLPELLDTSTVVALSSRSEGSPVALLEALAAGRCVVSVPVGGVVDILKNRPGAVLVASRSPDDLARGIIRALTDTALHSAAHRHRSEVVRDFSIDRLLDDMASLYEELWHQRVGSS